MIMIWLEKEGKHNNVKVCHINRASTQFSKPLLLTLTTSSSHSPSIMNSNAKLCMTSRATSSSAGSFMVAKPKRNLSSNKAKWPVIHTQTLSHTPRQIISQQTPALWASSIFVRLRMTQKSALSEGETFETWPV